jgi:hypothetical protein
MGASEVLMWLMKKYASWALTLHPLDTGSTFITTGEWAHHSYAVAASTAAD